MSRGPAVEGRLLCLELDEHYRRVLHRRRGAGDPSPEAAANSLRNRMIIQEMRNAYDRLAGVGDELVDARILGAVREKGGVSRLSRADIEELNRDLRVIGGLVFGDVVAAHVEEHIARFIQQVLA